jgi:hypothetical protein
MRQTTKPISALLLTAGLLLSACDAGPASGAGDTIVTSDPAQSAAPQAPAPAPSPPVQPEPAPHGEASVLGTRENPAPFGATALIGDWEVTLLAADTDAESRVLAANMFNDPSGAGFSYVLIEVSAEYVGSESGDPAWDLSWKLLGNRGNTFDESCGVIPDPLRDGGETFPGGIVTGNVCVKASEDQLARSSVIVEGFFRESRTFFALP